MYIRSRTTKRFRNRGRWSSRPESRATTGCRRGRSARSRGNDERGRPPPRVPAEWITSCRASVLDSARRTTRWLDVARKRRRKTPPPPPICCSPRNWTRPPRPQVNMQRDTQPTNLTYCITCVWTSIRVHYGLQPEKLVLGPETFDRLNWARELDPR